MEGMGAHSGTPRHLDVLIASKDIVAAEIVGTQVMGFDPMATCGYAIGLEG